MTSPMRFWNDMQVTGDLVIMVIIAWRLIVRYWFVICPYEKKNIREIWTEIKKSFL